MDSLQPHQPQQPPQQPPQQQQMPGHTHPHPPPAPPPLPLVAAHLPPPPRPYLPPEMAYPDPHLLAKMPIHQNKFAPKRTIKMPRRDRAPKMVRSTVDGLHYTLARMDDQPPPAVMTVNGYPTTIAPAK